MRLRTVFVRERARARGHVRGVCARQLHFVAVLGNKLAADRKHHAHGVPTQVGQRPAGHMKPGHCRPRQRAPRQPL